jgi:hypothetical protein
MCGATYLLFLFSPSSRPLLILFSSSSLPLQVLTTALLFRGVFALILFTLALPGVLLWSPGWIAIKVLERKVRERRENAGGVAQNGVQCVCTR